MSNALVVRTEALWVVANSVPPARKAKIDRARFQQAPCYVCGYNGQGYYQASQHSCALAYHDATKHVYERCPHFEALVNVARDALGLPHYPAVVTREMIR